MIKSILFFLIFSPTLLFAQFNDCKEYGFKGDISKVTTRTYTDLIKENGKWIINENNLVSILEFYVDQNNNFKKVKALYFENDSTITETYIYKFENNLKSSYVKYNEKDSILEIAKYDWINEKAYKATFTSKDRVIESLSILNDKYRDYYGEIIYYYADSTQKYLVNYEKYRNYLNAKDHPIKTKKINLIQNDTSFVYNDIQDIDRKGNMTEFAILNKNEKLKKFIKREFEYKN